MTQQGAIIGAPTAVLSGNAGQILLASGFNVNALRGNDLLRKDEWKALDDVVVETVRREIGAMDDLRSAGLTRSLGGLGVLLDEYERQSDVDAAEQSMSGVTAGQKDLAEWSLASVPIPITFKDFSVNLRHLEASRRRGSNIDTTNVDLATRRVLEALEDMLFNGSTVSIGGNTVAGYTTVASRMTGSVTATWTNAGTRAIMTDVLAMVSAAEAANYRGPFMLYVPVSWMSVLREDYSTAKGDRTYMERILAIDVIQGIRGSASLTEECVLVQMTRDVVDLSIAQDIVTVNWPGHGGLTENFKVMAAIAPRVKSPYSGNTGVVHYSV